MRVAVEGDDQTLSVRVTDTGRRASPTTCATASSPSSSSSTAPAPVGPAARRLGLAICKTLVELMGGTIAFSPSPEGGACFAVTLPRARGGSPPPRPARALDVAAPEVETGAPKILVVDDNRDLTAPCC
ncbi:ATP-binding protein [Caulobacter segnis]